MARILYYIRDDATGYCIAEGFEERSDWDKTQLLAAVKMRQPAGRIVLDAETNAKPPAPPDLLAPKRVRLADLRAKGWTNLTAAEREEARGLVFDLGGAP